MNLCRDCVHCDQTNGVAMCMHDAALTRKIDPVDGEEVVERWTCRAMRMFDGNPGCGSKNDLFVAKETVTA